jgi:hypothetical protein
MICPYSSIAGASALSMAKSKSARPFSSYKAAKRYIASGVACGSAFAPL